MCGSGVENEKTSVPDLCAVIIIYCERKQIKMMEE